MTIVGKNLFDVGESKPTLNYKRRYKSPIFSFNIGAIAASSKAVLVFEDAKPAVKKYINLSSFNNLRIFNNSNSAILIHLNQNSETVVPVAAGTSEVIDKEAMGGVSSLLVEELDANAITASQVRIQVWKDRSDVDSIVTGIHETAFVEDFRGLSKIQSFLQGGKKGGAV